jgi:hypothetical protein
MVFWRMFHERMSNAGAIFRRSLYAATDLAVIAVVTVGLGLSTEVDTYHGIVPDRVSRIDPAVIEGNVTVDISLEGALPKGARPDLSVVGTIEIERLEDVVYAGRPVFASQDTAVELFKLVDDGSGRRVGDSSNRPLITNRGSSKWVL